MWTTLYITWSMSQQIKRANRLAQSTVLQPMEDSSGLTIKKTTSAGSKPRILTGDTILMSFLEAVPVDFSTGQSVRDSHQLRSLSQSQTPTIPRNYALTEIQAQSVLWNPLQVPGWRSTWGQELVWTRSRSDTCCQESRTEISAKCGLTKFGLLTPCRHQVLISLIFQFHHYIFRQWAFHRWNTAGFF